MRGVANLTLNGSNNTLLVNINATGLEPNQPHPQHIHGLLGGLNATVPTVACCDSEPRRIYRSTRRGTHLRTSIVKPHIAAGLPRRSWRPCCGLSHCGRGVINFSQLYDLGGPHTFTGLSPPLGANTGVAALFSIGESSHRPPWTHRRGRHRHWHNA